MVWFLLKHLKPKLAWIRKAEWQGPVLVLSRPFVHRFPTGTWGHLHTSLPQTQLHFLGEGNGLLGEESDLLIQPNAF